MKYEDPKEPTCPQPVMRLECDDAGMEKNWTVSVCGEPVRLLVEGVADLSQFMDGTESEWTDLSQEVYVYTWQVECDAGHVIVKGYTDGGDPEPFTLAQVRAAGVAL